MIRVMFCLRRKPTMSADEFHAYWFEHHGPLVASRASVLGISRYIQLHPVSSPLATALSRPRGGVEPFDGIAEIWIDVEALPADTTSEARRAARELLDDERNFIDLDRSPLWLYDARVIYADPD